MRMRLREPRIKPLDESEWSEEEKQILNPLKMAGHVFNIFTTLARHPTMMKAYIPFGAYIL